MGNQAAVIGIVIHAIEKCINSSFVRPITGLRYGVLRDPLRDCDPLDRALTTSLITITLIKQGLSVDRKSLDQGISPDLINP